MASQHGRPTGDFFAPSPLPPITDPRLIAQWLSDITGEPLTVVYRKLAAECRLVGHNVREAAQQFGLAPHVWNERLLEFYSHTDAFLYETVVWNASRMKQRLRERICRELTSRLPAGAEVLCFGDGMGFDSAALARQGFHATCFEVSDCCREFARRVFELNRLDCRIATDEAQFLPGEYDAIVCLDVLEHIPDPKAVIRRFSSWLKEGGLLVVHAPFYHVDSTRPTHLRCNRCYSGRVRGLYRDAGFRVVNCGGMLLNPLVLRKCAADGGVEISLGLRLRMCLSQVLLYLARGLPFVPGMIASRMCRPPKAWMRQLVGAPSNKILSFVQRRIPSDLSVPARKCA